MRINLIGRRMFSAANLLLHSPTWAFTIAAAILLISCNSGDDDRSLRQVSTLCGQSGEIGEPFGVAARGNDIFVSDGQNGRILKCSAGELSVFSEGFDTPSGVAFTADGHLVVADSGSNEILIIDSFGKVARTYGIKGSPGNDDGDARSARFRGPIGIAVSPEGTIFVADTYNDRIRKIENGQVSTIAGSVRGFSDGLGPTAMFDTPTGITIYNGRLYLADTGNRRIRTIDQNGTVLSLAGSGDGELVDGMLFSSSFVEPVGVATDRSGTIYVADGNTIRTIGGALPRVTTLSSDRRGLSDGNRSRARFNRPSGLAVLDSGDLIIADSENRVIRRMSHLSDGKVLSENEITSMRDKPAEFRSAAPGRWPYDPPTVKRDIAGTLGEIRGEMTQTAENVWFHNGLDIAGGYGETARFIRDEKVLRPIAAENFGTLRELIRMPTLGYIHIRLGRNSDGTPFGDERFQFQTDASGKLVNVRVPRGTKFKAGEAIGTLNPMNHVHLIAGRSGSEMNALDALILPGISDSRPPVIEKITIYDQNWIPVETSVGNSRIRLSGDSRIVAKGYDQVDGNADRRRLGIYKLGYSVNRVGDTRAEPKWTIVFDRMPPSDAVRFVYAEKSYSGATGETVFNYIVTNYLSGDEFREEFLRLEPLEPGPYKLNIFAADYFGNISVKDIDIEVIR